MYGTPPKQVTHTKAAYLFRTDVASQKNTKNYSRHKTEKNMMLDFVVTAKLFPTELKFDHTFTKK